MTNGPTATDISFSDAMAVTELHPNDDGGISLVFTPSESSEAAFVHLQGQFTDTGYSSIVGNVDGKPALTFTEVERNAIETVHRVSRDAVSINFHDAMALTELHPNEDGGISLVFDSSAKGPAAQAFALLKTMFNETGFHCTSSAVDGKPSLDFPEAERQAVIGAHYKVVGAPSSRP